MLADSAHEITWGSMLSLWRCTSHWCLLLLVGKYFNYDSHRASILCQLIPTCSCQVIAVTVVSYTLGSPIRPQNDATHPH